jgi:hypothetical protein
MTEDDVSRGLSQSSVISGEPFESAPGPAKVESVIAVLPGANGGAGELWKLNHYYDRLDEWHAAHGIVPNPFASPAADPLFELHNLSQDPEERLNLAAAATPPPELWQLQSLLESQRDEKRLLPLHRNPA